MYPKLFLAICQLSLCVFIGNSSYAQQPFDSRFENVFDAWYEANGNTEDDFQPYLLALEELKRAPLDLNKLKAIDLDNFFFLSENQKNELLNHVQLYGPFLSLEELQTLPSLSEEVIQMIRPFVYVKQEESFLLSTQLLTEGNHVLYLKWKQKFPNGQNGNEPDTNWMGSPAHWVARYKWEGSAYLKAGFIAEIDPGEKMAWNKKMKWADYFSCYLQLKKRWKWVDELIVGDFAPSFGQGLLIHNGFGAGKSSLVMHIRKQGSTFRPYTSVSESGYFRGIANVIQIHRSMHLSWFYSHKDIDTRLTQAEADTNQIEIVSIITSGYHRTLNELENKQNASQQNIGVQLMWKYKRFQLSHNHLSYLYKYPIAKGNHEYELFEFYGKNNHLNSIDWKWSVKNFSTFGELARSDNNGWALLHGFLLSLDKTLDLSLLYRNYARHYQCIDCNALGESSKAQGEKGIYVGLEWRPFHQWKISSYLDFWQHHWLRYQTDAPSNGKELLIRIEHTIKRKFNVYVQYFLESKETNNGSGYYKIEGLIQKNRHKLRWHYSWQAHPALELRSRAEFTWISNSDKIEKGYLLYQDLIYHPKSSPLSLSTRYAIFHTGGFDSRIYAYENDILYESALPFMSGIGRRAYLNLRYKVHKRLTAEFRYAQTRYQTYKNPVLDSLQDNGSNRDMDIKMQLKIQL